MTMPQLGTPIHTTMLNRGVGAILQTQRLKGPSGLHRYTLVRIEVRTYRCALPCRSAGTQAAAIGAAQVGTAAAAGQSVT